MIIEARKKPLPLQKLEALSLRLSPRFSRLSELQGDIAIRYKGYIGEKRVDYYLDKRVNKFTIIPDICLEVYGKRFQIDSLIITQHATYLIEAKNFDGTITFDTILKQFTRDDGEKESGYRYPITQAESSRTNLQIWLQKRGFHNVPVHFFIAISEPSTIIKVIGDEESIAKVVGHAEHIPSKIIELDDKLRSRHKGGHVRLPGRKIGEAILQECQDFDIDIIRQYRVRESDILTGVQCPGCKRLGMERGYGVWICSRCNTQSKYAHKKALSDYFLLVRPWITNKECMQFLHIKSRSVVTRILQSSNLVYQKKHKRWTKKS